MTIVLRRTAAFGFVLALVAVLAACGDDPGRTNDSSAASPSPREATTSSPAGATPAEASALVGEWVLTAFGEEPTDSEVESTLTVAEGGKVLGNAGVNRYFGTYEASEAGRVTFSPLGATQMAGPQNAMDQEQRLLAAFEEVASFSVDDGTLVLTDATATPVLVFAPAP